MTLRQFIRRQREDGQVLVLFALASLVLVGAMALAIDVGYLLSERREAQAAADAAAIAAAADVYAGESHATAQSSARAYSALNGVADGDGGASVAVQVTGDSKDGRVEVNVTNPAQRFFLGAVYTGPWQVEARAVAEIHEAREGDYALITLQPPGTKFNGNNAITIHNGSAMTNDAVNANPSNAHSFVVDGAIDSAGAIHNPNSNWVGDLNDNIQPIDDPIVVEGVSSPNRPSGTPLTPPDCSSDCAWAPGFYSGGSVTIKRHATFMPGLYYFEDFDLSFQNTNSRIEGDEVMLYFDDDSTFNPKNGEMYITAPSTSPYSGGKDGMVFWYDACNTIESRGNSDYYFEGVLYAPCADLVFRGTPDTPVNNGQMIVGSVEMMGTGTIEITYQNYFDITVLGVFLVE